MTGVVVTGFGAVSSVGVGAEPLAAALRNGEPPPAREASELYEEPLPSRPAHAFVDLDVRELLGRKGTSSYDRCTALALVACANALEDSGLEVDDANRHRVGVSLGTTLGSLKSMSDYTRESLVEERPYLVNPALFPNTVMNCAAGQAAIRFGLRGINSTIAAGQVALHGVLRYATRALRLGHVDAFLAGAVEELTPHRAWATQLGRLDDGLAVGEGAAVFVLEPEEQAREAGRHVEGEILSVVTAFSPGGEAGGELPRALERCVRRALEQAGVGAEEVALVAGGDERDGTLGRAVAAALGGSEVESVSVRRALGECHAASSALDLAALLTLHRDDPARDGALSLVTASTPEGNVAAAVCRGFARVHADRR